MAAISEVIRYLRGCYEADNREASIFNLRSERVEHLEFLSKGGDFVRGLLDVVPVERGKALEAQKAAELYKTERSLVFASVLLTGSVEGPRGKAEVFAPMFYYPARVEDLVEYAVLRVDWQQQRVNTRLLQAMMGEAEKEFDALLGKIPNAPFKPTDLYDLIALLEEFAPGINTTHLRQFANSEVALREVPSEKNDQPRAWWGHVMALIPNSPETRGVLTEMEEVAAAQRHSAPDPGGVWRGIEWDVTREGAAVYLASAVERGTGEGGLERGSEYFDGPAWSARHGEELHQRGAGAGPCGPRKIGVDRRQN